LNQSNYKNIDLEKYKKKKIIEKQVKKKRKITNGGGNVLNKIM